jgi:hypothetical protein
VCQLRQFAAINHLRTTDIHDLLYSTPARVDNFLIVTPFSVLSPSIHECLDQRLCKPVPSNLGHVKS